MILKELLERSEYTLVQGSEDVEISTLVYDSISSCKFIMSNSFSGL